LIKNIYSIFYNRFTFLLNFNISFPEVETSSMAL